MPRFVVLWHESGPSLRRSSHFDLLFEEDTDAKAWYFEEQLESRSDVPAWELPRHRLHYFTYEGPLSGGRGVVSRWDQGDYRPLLSTADQFEAQLQGMRLSGTLRMSRTNEQEWRLRFDATP